MTVGMLLLAAFLLIVFGASAAGGLQRELAQAWVWIRWPLGTLLTVVALAALFKVAPNRRQPPFGWLMLGGALSAAGWLIVSVTLAFYLNASKIFGETYGPLAGFMGLMLWVFLSGIAIFYGLSVAAHLESRRVGIDEPVVEANRRRPRTRNTRRGSRHDQCPGVGGNPRPPRLSCRSRGRREIEPGT